MNRLLALSLLLVALALGACALVTGIAQIFFAFRIRRAIK